MTRYRVTLCDHPDCELPAVRRVVLGHQVPPNVGPLFVSANHAEPQPSQVIDACADHARTLQVDAFACRAWWPDAAAEPVAIPVDEIGGRAWAVIEGGRSRAVAGHQLQEPEN